MDSTEQLRQANLNRVQDDPVVKLREQHELKACKCLKYYLTNNLFNFYYFYFQSTPIRRSDRIAQRELNPAPLAKMKNVCFHVTNKTGEWMQETLELGSVCDLFYRVRLPEQITKVQRRKDDPTQTSGTRV